MLPLKLRLKMLNKIAQAVPGAPASPASPASPSALPAQPATTTPSSTTAATIPPPPNFKASAAWGWLGGSGLYNPTSVGFLDGLVSLLNTALHYASEGAFNWEKLRNNFNVDPSGLHSVDAKNLFNLSKLVYQSYLNSGTQFPAKVTGTQIAAWNNAVMQAQSYLNLSQLNPTGVVAQKMPGNLKDNIASILRQLTQYNPVQPQQPR
jgi:hypothetical protein